MRGRFACRPARFLCFRLTPAHAGKISTKCRWSGWTTAHPRACGEDFEEAYRRLQCQGSPPRMRGRSGHPGLAPGRAGLTPAHAGTIQSGSFAILSVRAHPRVCGEDGGGKTSWALQIGSPPRIRGRYIRQFIVYHQVGLTPAYAGKIVVFKPFFGPRDTAFVKLDGTNCFDVLLLFEVFARNPGLLFQEKCRFLDLRFYVFREAAPRRYLI